MQHNTGIKEAENFLNNILSFEVNDITLSLTKVLGSNLVLGMQER